MKKPASLTRWKIISQLWPCIQNHTTYLDDVEQLDNTDRLSQKAESVSGLSVRFPFTVIGFLAVSELVGLDLDSPVLEVTEATGEGCLTTFWEVEWLPFNPCEEVSLISSWNWDSKMLNSPKMASNSSSCVSSKLIKEHLYWFFKFVLAASVDCCCCCLLLTTGAVPFPFGGALWNPFSPLVGDAISWK